MNKILHPLLLLLFPLLSFAQVNGWKINPVLQQKMNEAPQAYLEVLIELTDQEDTYGMLARFERDKIPLQQRSVEVITRLQSKADATQPAVIARLKETQGVNAAAIYSLWINNSLLVLAKPDAIIRIADWAEIKALNWNAPAELEAMTVSYASAPSPNGTEPGLRAIKAPFMWKKGYTGYGRKAMIIDTGQDGDHPALSANFWGNNVPVNQAWHGSTIPEDCGDHGTHVAGIIAGLDRKTNDTIGVAFNAHWIGAPMQFSIGAESGCQRAFTQTVYSNYNSFQWALNPDGNVQTTIDMPDVINCSWKSGNFGCGISQAINLLNACEAAGIAVVFAQGNDGPGAGTVESGGAMNMDLVNTFSIGAVNGAIASFPIADFSSRGPTTCNNATGSLQIKPEVSAPGVNVRSSFNGGVYQSIDGTSMAAPHVAGAIVLLKEAFPALSGTAIKLALYYTADDLGQPGEDNTYGNGMINLEKAFNYLVDAGNVPATPVAYQHEALLIDLETKAVCVGPVNSGITVENAGTENITSLKIAYQIAGGSLQTFDWTGIILPDNVVQIDLPEINGINPGNYTMTAQITEVNGGPDDRPLNNKFSTSFTMANDNYAKVDIGAGQMLPACKNSRILLEYKTDLQPNETVKWYSNANTSSALAEGSKFLTPPLGLDVTYYVSTDSRYQVGKLALPASGNNSNNNGGALEFDALQDLTIRTVKVYADETGARIVQLLDNTGAVLATKAITISSVGEQRLTLNFKVPKGTGYNLKLNGSNNLRTTSTMAGYPYLIPNIINLIRGVTPSGVNTSFVYYYFFDWEIDVPLICGRTAVPVQVVDPPAAPVVAFTSAADTIVLAVSGDLAFNDESPDAASRLWDFGNGTTSTVANPVATYTAAGNYTVYLTINSAAGCSNTTSKVITVLSTSGTNTPLPKEVVEMMVYPNPASDVLNVIFTDDFVPKNGKLQLRDVTGRLIQTANVSGNLWTGNVAGLSPGVYFVEVSAADGRTWSARFVK